MKSFRKILLFALSGLAPMMFLVQARFSPAVNASPGGSDPQAVKIAKEVIRAMGGQKEWNNAHYISWNFFGRRKLVWDKWKNVVRIDWVNTARQVQVDLISGKGYVELNGVPQNNPDSLAKYLKTGKEVWINDSYWLVMPFKLLDPGVTLKYGGREIIPDGRTADILELTFDHVGVTPQNKYRIWVDAKSRLVIMWDYFENATDKTPKISNTWDDYKPYGKILLSGVRGQRGNLYPIVVSDEVPAGTFHSF